MGKNIFITYDCPDGIHVRDITPNFRKRCGICSKKGPKLAFLAERQPALTPSPYFSPE